MAAGPLDITTGMHWLHRIDSPVAFTNLVQEEEQVAEGGAGYRADMTRSAQVDIPRFALLAAISRQGMWRNASVHPTAAGLPNSAIADAAHAEPG